MIKEIETILQQKHWTGDQVGKALIASAIHAYRQAIAPAGSSAELFSAAQLKKMVDSLSNREQLLRYNRYVGLNNWLTQYQAVANAYMQLAHSDIEALSFTLNVAKAVEEDAETIGVAPRAVSTTCGLEQYTDASDMAEEYNIALSRRRWEILHAYRHLLGYDCAIELIAEHIEMPEFLIFASGCHFLPSHLHSLARQAHALAARIEASEVNSPPVKEAKLRVLRECFSPILPENREFRVPNAAIEKATAMLQDNMRAFEKQDGVFMRIFTDWGEEP